MKKELALIAASSLLSLGLAAQTALPVVIDSDTTLEAFSEYSLVGVHYVAPGATLTIEEGVTIYAETEDNRTEAPALIIAAGAQINAVGTADAPIVFTSAAALSDDLDHNDVGLWSGIIMLGNATINADATEVASGSSTLTNEIEGVTAIGRGGLTPAVEASYLTYGGDDDEDSSGTLSYVSIRHTGFSLTGIAGDEIQGLTLGGVGSGTTLSNIEIFVSDDDGIEIFGGTANLSNIAIAYAEDDSLDFDQGYRGSIQNVFVLQVAFTDETARERNGDHGGEWDGADSPETNTPTSGFTVANATFVQAGASGATNDDVIRMRNAGIGQLWNSAVFTNDTQLIRLDNNTDNDIVEDAVTAGDIAFRGNLFYSTDSSVTAFDATTMDINDFADTAAAIATVTASSANNQILDPSISVTVDSDGMAVVSIPSTGELFDTDNVVEIPSSATDLTNLGYIGAFSASENWASWTFLSQEGYLLSDGAAAGGSGESALAALSGRFYIADGEEETIVGLIVDDSVTLAITAKGESISGSVDNFLADPEITIVRLEGGRFVEFTGDVNENASFPSVIAPEESATNDEAFVINLDAGVYGIRVSSGDGTSGIALVEAYDMRYFN